MVSIFERNLSLGGIFSLYSFIVYKFIVTRNSFNKKFHDTLILKGEQFEKDINSPSLKFVTTPNQKLLFLLGIENNQNALKDDNLYIYEKLIEHFTPTSIVYERDLKL